MTLHDEEDEGLRHKKQKTHHSVNAASTHNHLTIPLLRSHPYNIKPIGNYYLDPAAYDCRSQGLGLLQTFFDESALLSFLQYFAINDLSRTLSCCSKALYVYSHEEDIYKAAVLRDFGGSFLYQHTWRNTYIYHYQIQQYQYHNNHRADIDHTNDNDIVHEAQQPAEQETLKINGFYSDLLFQSFYCSSMDLRYFNNEDNIDRIDIQDRTIQQFRACYSIPNRPVIISGVVNQWPAASLWTNHHLLSQYGNDLFKIGAINMSLSNYLRYADQCHDESPLYLFDSAFGEKYPDMLKQYTVPDVFNEDLFGLLEELAAREGYNDGCEDRETPGSMQTRTTVPYQRSRQNHTTHSSNASSSPAIQNNNNHNSNSSCNPIDPNRLYGSMRPAYRWVLIGPARSGSTFHKDPNHTSAWNGLITGEKRWILYPPNQPPPGVFPSADERDVITPISVSEWLLHYYQQHTQRMKDYQKRRQQQQQQSDHNNNNNNNNTDTIAEYKDDINDSNDDLKYVPNTNDYSQCGPIECVCHPGDLLFIPNGWWHLAVNITPSIAVTQNFVNSHNVLNVLQFLQQEGNTILYEAFQQQLQRYHPGLIDKLENIKAARSKSLVEQHEAKKRAAQQARGGSLWEQMI